VRERACAVLRRDGAEWDDEKEKESESEDHGVAE